MTISAGIAFTRTPREIPEANHATMGTIQVIAMLGSVALCAEFAGLLKWQRRAVGEA